MIDIANERRLTQNERADIVRRALYSQPYFYKMAFPILTGGEKIILTSGAIGINRDFYLTELQGNFDQVFTDAGTLFDLTLYTGYNRSLWRFNSGQKIPTGFTLTDARFRVPVPNQIFDDRQFENFPIHIQKNDRVIAELVNVEPKIADAEAVIVLKGFNVSPGDSYVDPSEFAEINRALDKENYDWEFFKIEVTDEGKRSFVISNDRFPRLILGFGAVNSSEIKAAASNATITIDDLSRRLRLTDNAIPVEFIAPRLTCLADAHFYYLPIEYYWQPLGKMQFTIENIFSPVLDAGFELVMLTRTL